MEPVSRGGNCSVKPVIAHLYNVRPFVAVF